MQNHGKFIFVGLGETSGFSWYYGGSGRLRSLEIRKGDKPSRMMTYY